LQLLFDFDKQLSIPMLVTDSGVRFLDESVRRLHHVVMDLHLAQACETKTLVLLSTKEVLYASFTLPSC
jgi:hypothetical protein